MRVKNFKSLFVLPLALGFAMSNASARKLVCSSEEDLSKAPYTKLPMEI
ncbi:hypothetical protein FACS1894152_5770 [Bacilli bacterium]|nr:hypothetical protein FACS1894152_5770 [Bacilli bacterium]